MGYENGISSPNLKGKNSLKDKNKIGRTVIKPIFKEGGLEDLRIGLDLSGLRWKPVT
jgi:hypothetical protein